MKNVYFLMLVGLLGLASCSSDESPAANEEKATVSIVAAINNDAQSRGTNTAGDEEVTRCVLQLIDEDDQDNQTITLNGSESDGFTANVSVYKHKTYTLLFWADCNDGTYTITDLTNVALAGTDYSVAYAQKGTYTYSAENTNISATLNHAVAKVTLKSSKALEAEKDVTITLPSVNPNYNVNTGAASGTPASKTFAHTTSAAIDENGTVFSFYAFVPGETRNITIQYDIAEAISVASVPISANTHTILSGDITGKVNTSFTVTITPDWNTTENMTF